MSTRTLCGVFFVGVFVRSTSLCGTNGPDDSMCVSCVICGLYTYMILVSYDSAVAVVARLAAFFFGGGIVMATAVVCVFWRDEYVCCFDPTSHFYVLNVAVPLLFFF